MWFKNCYIYRLSEEFNHTADSLNEKLESKRFSALSSQADDAFGWVSPLNRHLELLVHSANGCHMLCMRKEQKVIPTSMVKETLEERIKAIEDAEGRKVYGKEKAALKDDILSVLKPRALSKSTHVFGYIDPRNGLLVINAGSNAVADSFIQLLIDSLEVLGAVRLIGEENPSTIMNQWLRSEMPNDWSLTGQYELKDPQDERVAKFKDSYDDSESGKSLITELLEDGYWVQKLGINYKDQFNAIIQHDLQIKSIKFAEELVNENEEIDSSDQYARFDADFVLMAQTLAEFIHDMSKQFKVLED